MRRRNLSVLARASFTPLSLTLAAILAAGCATPPEPPTGPGFLGGVGVYDQLMPSERDPTIFILRSTRLSYRDYQMVLLDPVQVVAPDGSALSVEENAEVIELMRMFRDVMQIEVGERYPIVTSPGPKTLRLRTAIVGYDRRDKTLFGLGTGATLEAEMLDSLSGDRIVAAVAPTQGQATPGREARQRAHAALTYWARLLRDRMDAERR